MDSLCPTSFGKDGFNYFETKEDLALYFFDREIDEGIGWFERNPRMKRAALPEKLFAIIQHSLERLEPYEDFIGAVYLRLVRLLRRSKSGDVDSFFKAP